MINLEDLAEYFRNNANGYGNRRTKRQIATWFGIIHDTNYDRAVRLAVERLRKPRKHDTHNAMAIVSNSKTTGYFLLNPDSRKDVTEAHIMIADNYSRVKELRKTNRPIERALGLIEGQLELGDKAWVESAKRRVDDDIDNAFVATRTHRADNGIKW